MLCLISAHAQSIFVLWHSTVTAIVILVFLFHKRWGKRSYLVDIESHHCSSVEGWRDARYFFFLKGLNDVQNEGCSPNVGLTMLCKCMTKAAAWYKKIHKTHIEAFFVPIGEKSRNLIPGAGPGTRVSHKQPALSKICWGWKFRSSD